MKRDPKEGEPRKYSLKLAREMRRKWTYSQPKLPNKPTVDHKKNYEFILTSETMIQKVTHAHIVGCTKSTKYRRSIR